MYQEILHEILTRNPGETTITTGSDGEVILKTVPMAALLVYRHRASKTPVQLQVVRGGFVYFKKENYEKWAAECKAVREGKIKQAKPRQWRKTVGGWQQK